MKIVFNVMFFYYLLFTLACQVDKNTNHQAHQAQNPIERMESGLVSIEKKDTIVEKEHKKEPDIVGRWKNERCHILIDIVKNDAGYFYTFQSKKREIKDSLNIIYDGDVPYLHFEGIKWSEYKGMLGPEHFEDMPDSLIVKKKPLVIPVGISAVYEAEIDDFIIQNYGNAMSYYVKLEEGCEKYLYFKRQTVAPIDTLSMLSNFMEQQIDHYHIMAWAAGDLDGDQTEDFILVMESDEPNSDLAGTSDGYPRKVVLLKNIDFPKFKLLATNDHIIQCSNCGGAGVGDPFQGITIKNTYFSFEQLFGACDKDFKVITFKYAKDNFFLHSIGTDSYSCNMEEGEYEVKVTHKQETRKNFGRITFENYKME